MRKVKALASAIAFCRRVDLCRDAIFRDKMASTEVIVSIGFVPNQRRPVSFCRDRIASAVDECDTTIARSKTFASSRGVNCLGEVSWLSKNGRRAASPRIMAP
jgi:hypothetical protein